MKRLIFLVVTVAVFCVMARAAPLPSDITKVVSFIFLADAAGNVAKDASKS
jgi:hypothetical protein